MKRILRRIAMVVAVAAATGGIAAAPSHADTVTPTPPTHVTTIHAHPNVDTGWGW